jgi:hypothetical protein
MIHLCFHFLKQNNKYTLENTENAIKNGKPSETGNIGYTRRRKTQHNMCWTPVCANKHK